MAKAIVVCRCSTCGNEFRKEKTCYNRREAESWEKWPADYFDVCSECWQKARKAASESDLPELIGSPKQITWALTIRQGKIRKITEIRNEAISNVSGVEGEQEIIDRIEAVYRWLLSQDQASYWIERRAKSADAMIFEATKSI